MSDVPIEELRGRLEDKKNPATSNPANDAFTFAIGRLTELIEKYE